MIRISVERVPGEGWYVEITDGRYRQESGGPTLAVTLRHVVGNWRSAPHKRRRRMRLVEGQL